MEAQRQVELDEGIEVEIQLSDKSPSMIDRRDRSAFVTLEDGLLVLRGSDGMVVTKVDVNLFPL